ncbi:MAG: M1 family metallopeptidase [Sphingomonadales bacterium]
MLRIVAVCLGAVVLSFQAFGQGVDQTKGNFQDKFRQLEEVLPTPNIYRTGSGAPGHGYWQQRADYVIKATLDDEGRRLTGTETITYTNNSPDSLRYLWLQLDQNRFAKHSDGSRSAAAGSKDRVSYRRFRAAVTNAAHDGGFRIGKVADALGGALPHTIVDTVMRIDLPQPLGPGGQVSVTIDWSYNIPEGKAIGARGGWEYFEKDGNNVYFIAQWYPRMSAYTDFDGWNTKQFLGAGEFTLEFGDFDVEITVPADHIVAATGVLQNPMKVLTKTQRARLKKARDADKPVFIVTKNEALEAQKDKARDTKTWKFRAENVRDFSFASSRKFVWDALGYKEPSDGRVIMAMSFYPEEGMPLWDKYSTHAIAHTLETYSKYTFPYPYPVAQSVNGPLGGGMEYPMITSNGPRPEEDADGNRTYDRRTKYGLISVVIHEIGHNWFPMIVDSDERNWTWMDEGLNSFLQILSEKEWEENYPSRRGDPADIVDYMISENQVPIMTQSDSILQFGNNAYAKPAAAFNILRETVMGRENFDFAFKEYARRWKFKRPNPADFFRTMEDASGIDLDWFWRGWFYSTDHVDVSIERVTLAKVNTEDPEVEEAYKRQKKADEPWTITRSRNQGIPRRVDKFPELLDFYNGNDEFTVTDKQRKDYKGLLRGLKGWEKELLAYDGNIYFIDFKNIGGLVTPLILAIEYADGSTEELRIPAEIWRRNAREVSKMLLTEKEIASITLDPHWETADAGVHNNNWPRKAVPSRIELFKQKRRNLMKEVLDGEKEAGKNKRKN